MHTQQQKNVKEIQYHEIQNPDRFEGGVYNRPLYEEALEAALHKVRSNLEIFADKYQHVSVGNVYTPEENKRWTSSFFPGMVYLAYDITGDREYSKYFDGYLKSFRWRVEKGHTVTHDLGFLYTLSCVANYKLTGKEEAKAVALKAADILITRYNEKGRYIQAWGPIGAKYPEVRIIIDTMLNLPLLYWASGVTGDKEYYEVAYNHAITASQYLVREDASSFHTYLMNPDTGEAVIGKTHQGFSDESTWARGQAWAVYGFVLTYVYTKEPYFLDAARKTANYFLNNLPEDHVPYWDFSFNKDNPDIRDSSAASITLCGLLELTKHVQGKERELYAKAAYKIAESLYTNYSTKNNPMSNGLIMHGMYNRTDGADECTSWGDYYYLEGLARLLRDWKLYW